jgi:NAD(P)-dependent dehydrogenase (short-subunit alcohol dehydrogenase family)
LRAASVRPSARVLYVHPRAARVKRARGDPRAVSKEDVVGSASRLDLFDLKGRVALITGSSRGIGRAIAERMAQAGAKVVVSSRKLDACEEVVQAIRKDGGEAIAVPCNISNKDELEVLVAKTREAFGKIDILVCNAAVNPHYGPTQEIPDSAFEKVLACNIRSNHWLCQLVIPEMAERRDGSVLIVSSIGGLKGSNTLGTYGLSKAADMALARNLATEWGPRNVRVNCIAPGLVRTDFAKALWENPEIYEQSVQRYPLRRIGEPDEIAGTAIFLASAAGSFVTGQTIVVDGGATIT